MHDLPPPPSGRPSPRWPRPRARTHRARHLPVEPPVNSAGNRERGGTGLPPLAVVDMVVHPRDNDLVIATHARGFYILDDVTPLQGLARARSASSRPGGATGTPPGRRVTLFPPMPATRYTPASDTSVLGNRVWVAPNKPYGARISYDLAEAAPPGEPVRIEVRDAGGRLVRTLEGPGRAGVNRAVWDLTEASSCTDPAALDTPADGRPRRRGSGTWVRALPGDYTVRLSALGEAVEAPLRVRLDPRITASAGDLQAWYREARRIESMACRIDGAVPRVAALEARLAELSRSAPDAALRAAAEEVRAALRPIRLGLYGDPRDPGHVNLQGRVGWFAIQVGHYTGRLTDAQIEWIGRFSTETDAVLAALASLERGAIAQLDARLKAAGLSGLGADGR